MCIILVHTVFSVMCEVPFNSLWPSDAIWCTKLGKLRLTSWLYAISWLNACLSPVRSNGNHLDSIIKISLKFDNLKFDSNVTEANDLKVFYLITANSRRIYNVRSVLKWWQSGLWWIHLPDQALPITNFPNEIVFGNDHFLQLLPTGLLANLILRKKWSFAIFMGPFY